MEEKLSSFLSLASNSLSQCNTSSNTSSNDTSSNDTYSPLFIHSLLATFLNHDTEACGKAEMLIFNLIQDANHKSIQNGVTSMNISPNPSSTPTPSTSIISLLEHACTSLTTTLTQSSTSTSTPLLPQLPNFPPISYPPSTCSILLPRVLSLSIRILLSLSITSPSSPLSFRNLTNNSNSVILTTILDIASSSLASDDILLRYAVMDVVVEDVIYKHIDRYYHPKPDDQNPVTKSSIEDVSSWLLSPPLLNLTTTLTTPPSTTDPIIQTSHLKILTAQYTLSLLHPTSEPSQLIKSTCIKTLTTLQPLLTPSSTPTLHLLLTNLSILLLYTTTPKNLPAKSLTSLLTTRNLPPSLKSCLVYSLSTNSVHGKLSDALDYIAGVNGETKGEVMVGWINDVDTKVKIEGYNLLSSYLSSTGSPGVGRII
eukprot:CAMPEP_0118668018 /NCGR_PEP_ID=MMETSP0785-20121206/20115_1 /TAXON_ID=91992 /ORGANISM="Bolidomonas pacifica, Strain CCMP 1866" /LENGTH=425 /DNA_ID=CAMNT_0006562549 /DNA_START=23 /DNA_END=1297 /DNA_ORIENTATION=+